MPSQSQPIAASSLLQKLMLKTDSALAGSEPASVISSSATLLATSTKSWSPCRQLKQVRLWTLVWFDILYPSTGIEFADELEAIQEHLAMVCRLDPEYGHNLGPAKTCKMDLLRAAARQLEPHLKGVRFLLQGPRFPLFGWTETIVALCTSVADSSRL